MDDVVRFNLKRLFDQTVCVHCEQPITELRWRLTLEVLSPDLPDVDEAGAVYCSMKCLRASDDEARELIDDID